MTASMLEHLSSLMMHWLAIVAGGVAAVATLVSAISKVLAWYPARRPIVVKLIRVEMGTYNTAGWREYTAPALRVSVRNRGSHSVQVEGLGLKIAAPPNPDMRIGFSSVAGRKLPIEMAPGAVLNANLPISRNRAYGTPHLRAYAILATGEEYESRTVRPADRPETPPTVVTTASRGDDHNGPLG